LGEQELGPLESYFAKALKQNGKNVNYINIHKLYPDPWRNFAKYSHRMPRKYDNKIQSRYFKVVNDSLISKYNSEKPSYVFIYNDCMVLPETINYFKSNGTKIIIFLGDDPNYLFPSKKTFLLTIMSADNVILPDTGWIDGLKMLGIKRIIYSPIGTDTEVFFETLTDESQKRMYQSDFLFIGTGYFLNAWGIRRAALLNELSGMNFKLFGDRLWNEMFPFFPDLKKHFILKQLFADQVNIACNCSKIYPVVVNSGVINGVSTRVFDCIASGIFILAEYRKDIEMLFPNDSIVCFKSKDELKEKADYFLKNEKERIERSEELRKIVLQKYTINISVKNILEQID
jgi:Glycosyl transferases group 1/DUF based on E. rectale Gene description (DUF3880)